MTIGSVQQHHLGGRVDQQHRGEIDRHLVPGILPRLDVGECPQGAHLALDQQGDLVPLRQIRRPEQVVEEGVHIFRLDLPLVTQRLDRLRVLDGPSQGDRPGARSAIARGIPGFPEMPADFEHVPTRQVALQQRLVHDVVGGAAQPGTRVDAAVVIEQHLLLIDRKQQRLGPVLVEEGNLPFQDGGQVDLLDARQLAFLDRVKDADQAAPDGGEGLRLGCTVLAEPGIALAPYPTAAGFLGLSLIPVIDAKLERRPSLDVAQFLQPRLDPIDEGIVPIGVGVVLQRHLADAPRGPGGQEIRPEGISLGAIGHRLAPLPDRAATQARPLGVIR